MSSQALTETLPRNRFRAASIALPLLLMLTATMLWGITNVVQKISLDHLGPFSIIAARCWLGALVLLPFALRERTRRSAGERLPVRSHAILSALSFCAALCLQQVSAGLTSATNMGFIINSCVVAVPLLLWLTGGEAPTGRVVFAGFTTATGAVLLSGFSTRFGAGDLLCLGAAFCYAIWTISVGRAVAGNGFATCITLLQLIFTAVVSTAIALVAEAPSLAQFAAFAPGLLFLGIFGTGLSFALSAQAQRGLPICVAAIMMNLEAVFTAIAGHVVLGDVLRATALLGGSMILAGCIFVQIRK